MNEAERIALTERVARALAWEELPETRQADIRRKAASVVNELRTEYEQHARIGWIFVQRDETETEEAER